MPSHHQISSPKATAPTIPLSIGHRILGGILVPPAINGRRESVLRTAELINDYFF
jgi:hypothetical protein